MREENFRWSEVEGWVVRPQADFGAAEQQRYDAEVDVEAEGVRCAAERHSYTMWVVWRGMVFYFGPCGPRAEPMPRGWRNNPDFHWTAYGRAVHHFH